jgi:hypothetical protein
MQVLPTLSTPFSLTENRYIFTDFQSDNELGQSVVQHQVEAAEARGCTFIPIVLICDEVTNAERMHSQERIELVKGGKGMLLDISVLHEMRGNGDVARVQCPEQLELDITELPPPEAAQKIEQHVRSIISGEKQLERLRGKWHPCLPGWLLCMEGY